MFSTSVLDALATLGYAAAVFGLMICILTYYAIPRAAKVLIKNNNKGVNDGNNPK